VERMTGGRWMAWSSLYPYTRTVFTHPSFATSRDAAKVYDDASQRKVAANADSS
jgi:hypothetical protein